MQRLRSSNARTRISGIDHISYVQAIRIGAPATDVGPFDESSRVLSSARLSASRQGKLAPSNIRGEICPKSSPSMHARFTA